MIALSIRVPWINLIMRGKKTIELRSWQTSYRGRLLLVTSKTIDKDAPRWPHIPPLPLGHAVGYCQLVRCRPMLPADVNDARCPYTPGYYSWNLADIRPIKPFPVRGKLRLFDVPLPQSKGIIP